MSNHGSTLVTSRTPLRGILVRVGALVAIVLLLTMLGARIADASTGRAPATVANFCTLNPGLGPMYLGAGDGVDYEWSIGSPSPDFFAVDTNGDSQVDAIAYAPYYGGQYHVEDLGLCAGPDSDVWYNAAKVRQLYQQGQSAANEAWAEMGPSMVFTAEMEAIDDAP